VFIFFTLFNIFEYVSPAYAARSQSMYQKALEAPEAQKDSVLALATDFRKPQLITAASLGSSQLELLETKIAKSLLGQAIRPKDLELFINTEILGSLDAISEPLEADVEVIIVSVLKQNDIEPKDISSDSDLERKLRDIVKRMEQKVKQVKDSGRTMIIKNGAEEISKLAQEEQLINHRGFKKKWKKAFSLSSPDIRAQERLVLLGLTREAELIEWVDQLKPEDWFQVKKAIQELIRKRNEKVLEHRLVAAKILELINQHIDAEEIFDWSQSIEETLLLGEAIPAVRQLAFYPDGKSLITGSVEGAVTVWDVMTRTPNPIGEPLKLEGPIRSIEFDPTGRHVLVESPKERKLLKAERLRARIPKTLAKDRGGYFKIAEGPDGEKRLERTMGTSVLWREGLKEQKHFSFPNIRRERFSSDGVRLLTYGASHAAKIVNAETNEPIVTHLRHFLSRINLSVMSPNGNFVATASDPLRTLYLWDILSEKKQRKTLEHNKKIVLVRFNPDSTKLLTVTEDNVLYQWDATSGEAIGAPIQYETEIKDVYYNSDGTQILVASEDKAQLRNAKNNKPYGAPLQHTGRVNAAIFSPAENKVVTSSDDGSARIWNAKTQEPISEPLVDDSAILSALFSPDGGRLATLLESGSIKVWYAPLSPEYQYLGQHFPELLPPTKPNTAIASSLGFRSRMKIRVNLAKAFLGRILFSMGLVALSGCGIFLPRETKIEDKEIAELSHLWGSPSSSKDKLMARVEQILSREPHRLNSRLVERIAFRCSTETDDYERLKILDCLEKLSMRDPKLFSVKVLRYILDDAGDARSSLSWEDVKLRKDSYVSYRDTSKLSRKIALSVIVNMSKKNASETIEKLFKDLFKDIEFHRYSLFGRLLNEIFVKKPDLYNSTMFENLLDRGIEQKKAETGYVPYYGPDNTWYQLVYILLRKNPDWITPRIFKKYLKAYWEWKNTRFIPLEYRIKILTTLLKRSPKTTTSDLMNRMMKNISSTHDPITRALALATLRAIFDVDPSNINKEVFELLLQKLSDKRNKVSWRSEAAVTEKNRARLTSSAILRLEEIKTLMLIVSNKPSLFNEKNLEKVVEQILGSYFEKLWIGYYGNFDRYLTNHYDNPAKLRFLRNVFFITIMRKRPELIEVLFKQIVMKEESLKKQYLLPNQRRELSRTIDLILGQRALMEEQRAMKKNVSLLASKDFKNKKEGLKHLEKLMAQSPDKAIHFLIREFPVQNWGSESQALVLKLITQNINWVKAGDLSPIRKSLMDVDWRVRERAFKLLIAVSNADVTLLTSGLVDSVFKNLKHENWEIRIKAFDALDIIAASKRFQWAHQEIVRQAEAGVKDRSTKGAKKALQVVRTLISSKSKEIDKKLVAAISKRIGDPDNRLRELVVATVKALAIEYGELLPGGVEQDLEDQLTDLEPDIRAYAVEGLAALVGLKRKGSQKKWKASVVETLEDPNGNVQEAAGESIVDLSLKNPEVFDAGMLNGLKEMLTHQNRDVRHFTQKVLNKIINLTKDEKLKKAIQALLQEAKSKGYIPETPMKRVKKQRKTSFREPLTPKWTPRSDIGIAKAASLGSSEFESDARRIAKQLLGKAIRPQKDVSTGNSLGEVKIGLGKHKRIIKNPLQHNFFIGTNVEPLSWFFEIENPEETVAPLFSQAGIQTDNIQRYSFFVSTLQKGTYFPGFVAEKKISEDKTQLIILPLKRLLTIDLDTVRLMASFSLLEHYKEAFKMPGDLLGRIVRPTDLEYQLLSPVFSDGVNLIDLKEVVVRAQDPKTDPVQPEFVASAPGMLALQKSLLEVIFNGVKVGLSPEQILVLPEIIDKYTFHIFYAAQFFGQDLKELAELYYKRGFLLNAFSFSLLEANLMNLSTEGEDVEQLTSLTFFEPSTGLEKTHALYDAEELWDMAKLDFEAALMFDPQHEAARKQLVEMQNNDPESLTDEELTDLKSDGESLGQRSLSDPEVSDAFDAAIKAVEDNEDLNPLRKFFIEQFSSELVRNKTLYNYTYKRMTTMALGFHPKMKGSFEKADLVLTFLEEIAENKSHGATGAISLWWKHSVLRTTPYDMVHQRAAQAEIEGIYKQRKFRADLRVDKTAIPFSIPRGFLFEIPINELFTEGRKEAPFYLGEQEKSNAGWLIQDENGRVFLEFFERDREGEKRFEIGKINARDGEERFEELRIGRSRSWSNIPISKDVKGVSLAHLSISRIGDTLHLIDMSDEGVALFLPYEWRKRIPSYKKAEVDPKLKLLRDMFYKTKKKITEGYVLDSEEREARQAELFEFLILHYLNANMAGLRIPDAMMEEVDGLVERFFTQEEIQDFNDRWFRRSVKLDKTIKGVWEGEMWAQMGHQDIRRGLLFVSHSSGLILSYFQSSSFFRVEVNDSRYKNFVSKDGFLYHSSSKTVSHRENMSFAEARGNLLEGFIEIKKDYFDRRKRIRDLDVGLWVPTRTEEHRHFNKVQVSAQKIVDEIKLHLRSTKGASLGQDSVQELNDNVQELSDMLLELAREWGARKIPALLLSKLQLAAARFLQDEDPINHIAVDIQEYLEQIQKHWETKFLGKHLEEKEEIKRVLKFIDQKIWPLIYAVMEAMRASSVDEKPQETDRRKGSKGKEININGHTVKFIEGPYTEELNTVKVKFEGASEGAVFSNELLYSHFSGTVIQDEDGRIGLELKKESDPPIQAIYWVSLLKSPEGEERFLVSLEVSSRDQDHFFIKSEQTVKAKQPKPNLSGNYNVSLRNAREGLEENIVFEREHPFALVDVIYLSYKNGKEVWVDFQMPGTTWSVKEQYEDMNRAIIEFGGDLDDEGEQLLKTILQISDPEIQKLILKEKYYFVENAAYDFEGPLGESEEGQDFLDNVLVPLSKMGEEVSVEVKTEVQRLIEELQKAKGQSLGENISRALIVTKPVNIFLDARDIKAFSLGQINEIFKFAVQNPKNLQVTVANSLGHEKHELLDLPNIRFTPESEVEAAKKVRRAEHNLHLSRTVDPSSDFKLIGANKFRYPNDDNGLLGVALLYTQSENRIAFLMEYGLKQVNGFFSAVNETLLALVQSHQADLVLVRAA